MSSRERRRQPAAAEHHLLRWPVSIAALVHEYQSCPLAVRIVDLSTSGCRLRAGFKLSEGRPIRLVIPGIAPIRALVARTDDGHVAVSFQIPLHSAVLRHVVAAHPPDPDGLEWNAQARVIMATAPAGP